jgi:dipeptidyl aminopeptidase/acylaminoacyl peptidase
MSARWPVTVRTMVVVGVAATAAAPVAAQARFDLTVANIMRGPEVVGREPANIQWTPDSRQIYFQWLPPGTDWRESARPYRVQPGAGARPEAVSVAHADSMAPVLAEGALSPDRRRKVTAVRGDLWLVELPSGNLRQLTATTEAESAPTFDRDGRQVFFRRGMNLFALELAAGATRQLTDIRPAPAPTPPRTPVGQRGWLAAEERRLLAALDDRLVRDSLNRVEREAREALAPRPLYLAPRESAGALLASPDGRYVLLTANTPAAETQNTMVPNFVSSTGYTEPINSRTKVGDAQGRQRVGMIEVATGTVTWLRPLAADSTGMFGGAFPLGWNDAGTSALLAVTTTNFEERHLLRVDASPATVTALDVLRDEAWVSGPCFGCGGWLPGEQGIWFVSEADGWAHLQVMAADGSGRVQRTRGSFEVLSARLTPDRRAWLLHTSEPSVYERHAYLAPVGGGAMTRLTGPVGGHTVTISPDGRTLANVYSEANRPPELFLQAPRANAAMQQVTTSPTDEWLAGPWIVPAIVTVPAADGVPVPARIYRPEDVGAETNGAAVIFVHGAGYLHNVHNYWSSYFREYMFHHLLAARGYVVLDIDYRGSAGYGRDWRTAIYRHMGGLDLQDQVDGSRYLQREFGIAPERIGIYGGSYGGFITLMALFTAPEHFGAGAALRSVTDWAHYNHGYTARILNEPQADSVAYRRSSPIYFAEGLADPLLIAHGMVDTNVHFQDVVRLAQRLIELGKTGWEFAVYPVENHGFERPDSWTDEYRRILELFERHLPARSPAPR